MRAGRRIISIIGMLLVAGLYCGQVMAFGLGPANVKSFLNQPLQVEVELLDASQADIDSVSVELASAADHARLSVPTDSLDSALDFSVHSAGGRSYVLIASDVPVSNPIMQILLDVHWSGGRILKEYMLFLDPPTLEIKAPPVAGRVAERSQAPARQPQVISSTVNPPSPAVNSSAVASSGAEYGPVRSGETLWAIANNVAQDSPYSVRQVMVAILQMNPRAFQNGDMNRLSRGAVLRIPSDSDLEAISSGEASRIVSEQAQRWRRRQASQEDTPVLSEAGSNEMVGEQPDRAPQTDASARLELVPPVEDSQGEPGSSSSTEASAADDQRVAGLQAELARQEEELISATQDNEHLRQRIAELEAIIAQQPEGLSLQDADLAQMQQRLQEGATTAEPDAATPEAATTPAESQQTDATLVDLAEGLADSIDAEGEDTQAGVPENLVDDSAQEQDSIGDPAAQTAAPAKAEPEPAPWWERFFPWWLLLLLVIPIAIFFIRRDRELNRSQDSFADRIIVDDDLDAQGSGASAQESSVEDLTEDAQEILRVLEHEEEESGLVDDVGAEKEEIQPSTQAEDPLDDPDVWITGSPPEAPEPSGEDEGFILAEDAADEQEASQDEAEDAADNQLHSDAEQIEVKLDLARAYLSMEDKEAASAILQDIIESGNETQQAEARKMLEEI